MLLLKNTKAISGAKYFGHTRHSLRGAVYKIVDILVFRLFINYET
jgi:hypothetical protein